VIRGDAGNCEGPPCYQADTLSLADAHMRFQAGEAEHSVPKLAALWDLFGSMFHRLCDQEPKKQSFGEGIEWQTWQQQLTAFSEAMKAAAGAWSLYSQRVVGTMAFSVMARAGSTVVIERRGADDAKLKDEIPVVLYMLEKRPVL